jgi:DivIVA domain-containing protein
VNGEEVRGTSFRRRPAGGYNAIEVDDLLRRVAAVLDAGHPAGLLIANATFQLGGNGPMTSTRSTGSWASSPTTGATLIGLDWALALGVTSPWRS